MCSRYSISVFGLDQYETFQRLDIDGAFRPHYNAAPSQLLPIVTMEEPEALTSAKFGIIPPWIREKKNVKRIVNARAETVNEKPTFKEASEIGRCIVPANGFFEWKKIEGTNKKQPYYLTLVNNKFMALAGIYSIDKLGNKEFAIITVPPNDSVKPIHDRMPAILRPGMDTEWLTPGSFNKVSHVLSPFHEDLEFRAISTLVNSPSTNSAEILEPLT